MFLTLSVMGYLHGFNIYKFVTLLSGEDSEELREGPNSNGSKINAGDAAPALLLRLAGKLALVDPPCSEDELMVVGVKLAGGDLHATTEGESGAGFGIGWMQATLADEQARSDELLGFAVVRASLKERCIGLQLRPEVLVRLVLRGRIPGNWPA